MERNIVLYSSVEINEICINKIKQIKKKILKEELYNKFARDLKSINEIAKTYDFQVEQLKLILGEDWYILYAEEEEYVYVLEWYGVNEKKTKLIQSLEMYNTFISFFLNHKECTFCGYMKQYTSYRFYEKMLKDGYFEEIKNKIYDKSELYRLSNLLILLKAKRESSTLSKSDIISNKEENIFHFVVFNLTDKFINKYSNNETLKLLLYKKTH